MSDFYLLKQFSKERLFLGNAPWDKYLPTKFQSLGMSVERLTLVITELADDLDCTGRCREIAERIFDWSCGEPVLAASEKRLINEDGLHFMDYKLTGSAFDDMESKAWMSNQ